MSNDLPQNQPTQQWVYPYPYPYAYAPMPPAPPTPPRSNRKRVLVGAGVGLVAAGTAVAVAAANSSGNALAGSGSIGGYTSPQQVPDTPRGGYFPFPSGSGNDQTSANVANTNQKTGVVVINSVLGYQGEISAGTGMIVTSNGEVLTNNHVVQGATRIVVTVASTGKRYNATVVGTDATDDIAVVQLSGASGLTTARFDNDSDKVKVGDKVTAVGNAGGTGTLTAASGAVVATGKSITASDDNGANAETLHNLIQVNANVVAGDSGGPLYASDGEIVGMDTAAGRSSQGRSGYAITIEDALGIAGQIESGVETSKIHVGSRGLLGVTVQDAAGGAQVVQLIPQGTAQKAGIAPGDVITRVGGTTISNAKDLHTVIAATHAGQQVSVTWTDTSGTSHHATVTLGTGPAD